MSVFARPIIIYLVQAALMLVGTILLQASSHLSQFIYKNFGFLEPYIPAIFRYRAIFGRTNDFMQYFSIHVFQIAVQLSFLLIFAAIFLSTIKGWRPEPLRLGREFLFWTACLIVISPSIELLCGSYAPTEHAFFSAKVDDLLRSIFLPTLNILLFVLMSLRFRGGSFERRWRRQDRNLDAA